MTERSVVVGRDGRAKAYRPLPKAARSAALTAGLAAYERGDFFDAHEELEPAWMGTDGLAERALQRTGIGGHLGADRLDDLVDQRRELGRPGGERLGGERLPRTVLLITHPKEASENWSPEP